MERNTVESSDLCVRLECADGCDIAVRRDLLAGPSPPLAVACSLLVASESLKVAETSQQWRLLVDLLASNESKSMQDRLAELSLPMLQALLNMAHKYDMAMLLGEVDQHLGHRLPAHLDMHQASQGYFLTWLILADQMHLSLTLDTILSSVATPTSALGRRGILAELGLLRTGICSCGGKDSRPGGAGPCSECKLERQLMRLSPRILVQLLRAVAQTGREEQKQKCGTASASPGLAAYGHAPAFSPTVASGLSKLTSLGLRSAAGICMAPAGPCLAFNGGYPSPWPAAHASFNPSPTTSHCEHLQEEKECSMQHSLCSSGAGQSTLWGQACVSSGACDCTGLEEACMERSGMQADLLLQETMNKEHGVHQQQLCGPACLITGVCVCSKVAC